MSLAKEGPLAGMLDHWLPILPLLMVLGKKSQNLVFINRLLLYPWIINKYMKSNQNFDFKLRYLKVNKIEHIRFHLDPIALL